MVVNNAIEKKSKKLSKKIILDLILNKVKLGVSPYSILNDYDIKKSRISYYVSMLEHKGIISKIGYGVWLKNRDVQKTDFEKLSKKSSMGTRGEMNIHAINISIPIITGKINLVKDFDGYAQKQFNNWIPEYKKVIVPIGFTLKNNNNKSIDVQIWSRRIVKIDEIQSVILRTLYFTQGLLKKHVELDILSAKVRTLHAIVQEKDMEKVMNKATKITIPLNRKTAKILDNDDQKDALVWTDASPYRGIESNDITYVKNYIMMPEKVERIERNMELFSENLRYLSENINAHIPAIIKLGENAETMGKMTEKLFETMQELVKFIKNKDNK